MGAVRFDTASWLPGAVLFGGFGFGVAGSQVESVGLNGPAYAYPSLSLPADANNEICGRLLAAPLNGTLFAYEDTSFVYRGTTDSVPWQMYVDGVAFGAPRTLFLRASSAQTIGGSHHHKNSDVRFQEYVDFVDNALGAAASEAENAEIAELISILCAVGAL